MRVLHSIPSVHPKMGGPSKAVFDIAATCFAAGIEPTIICGSTKDDQPMLEEMRMKYPFVDLRDFPYSFPERFSASRAMARWLAEHVVEYDLVHVHAVYSLTSRMWCDPLARSIDSMFARKESSNIHLAGVRSGGCCRGPGAFTALLKGKQ
jgi:hypothetical protein